MTKKYLLKIGTQNFIVDNEEWATKFMTCINKLTQVDIEFTQTDPRRKALTYTKNPIDMSIELTHTPIVRAGILKEDKQPQPSRVEITLEKSSGST